MSYKRVFGGLALSAAIGANITGCAGWPNVPNPQFNRGYGSPLGQQAIKAKPVLVNAAQECHTTDANNGLSGGAASYASVNAECADKKAAIKPITITVTEPGGQGGHGGQGAQGGNATIYLSEKKVFAGEAAEELGNRANYSGNVSSIKSCFQELNIEERPLMFINVTDARPVVDCTDQKTLKAFWNDDPLAKRHEVANIIRKGKDFSKPENKYFVAQMIDMNDKFTRMVATECAQPGTPMIAEFVECASRKYGSEDNKQLGIAMLVALGVVAGGGIGSAIYTRRKKARNAVVSNAQDYSLNNE